MSAEKRGSVWDRYYADRKGVPGARGSLEACRLSLSYLISDFNCIGCRLNEAYENNFKKFENTMRA